MDPQVLLGGDPSVYHSNTRPHHLHPGILAESWELSSLEPDPPAGLGSVPGVQLL